MTATQTTYEQELAKLDTDEAFALAQGREDLVDEIEAKRELIQQAKREREALVYYAEGRYPDGGEIARGALDYPFSAGDEFARFDG